MNPTDERIVSKIDQLQETLNAFHPVFLETFPSHHGEKSDVESSFEPRALWDLSIKAQSLLATFGPVALERFQRLGFGIYFGFDNPADRHAWCQTVREFEIPQGIFLSIAQRIEAELARLLICVQQGGLEAYNNLGGQAFIVSADRWRALFAGAERAA
jgi:hypothetical protein